jgi:NAD(P)-dependent dehydrogenase (short-subunit alcohol dehydrogenase family)
MASVRPTERTRSPADAGADVPADGWSLRGKVAIVTGATSGLGRVTAEALARGGARVFLVCRDEGRGRRAAEEIAAATGSREVAMLVGDLAAHASVRAVASAFLARGEPLHVLVNNAGGLFGFRRQQSPDGIELTFALNHLAYYTLTLLLLDRLLASAPARIVNVASDGYTMAGGRFSFDDVGAERRYSPIRQYGRSKLANILFTRELARRLAGTGVTANSASPPGLTATRFAYGAHPFARFVMPLLRPFARSPDEGAESQVFLCASPSVDGVSGRHYSGTRPASLRPEACNDDDARRLWELSAELTGLNFPERRR